MSVGALARFGVDFVDEKQSAFFKAKLNISKRLILPNIRKGRVKKKRKKRDFYHSGPKVIKMTFFNPSLIQLGKNYL